MGNIGSSNNSGHGNSLGYGPELQCCDEVVDPVSLFAAIGAIAAASLFLRQAVIDNMIMGKRRKKRTLSQELRAGKKPSES